MNNKVQVIGIKYNRNGIFGDFKWMCAREEYENSLFLFNDNEEYHYTCRSGAGNAIMRRYNKHSDLDIPISAGIPTGTLARGGYSKLTTRTKTCIDDAFKEIDELLSKYKYSRIYYSAETDGLLGTSIFRVDPDVIKYISVKIFNLSDYPVQIIKTMGLDYFSDEKFEILDDDSSSYDSDSDSDSEKDEEKKYHK